MKQETKRELTPKFRFPEFTDEWKWKELGKLIEIKGRIGYRGYTTNDIVKKGEGAISLSPTNISETGSLSFEKSTYISWDKYVESPEIMLERGYTVLVKTGSSYGKAALVKVLPEKTTINPQLVILKPIRVNNVFLFLLVSNMSIQRQIRETVVGGAIPTLSQESISKFNVLIPSKDEQQKIADCLSSLDEMIAGQSQKLDTLKAHKKGLLQQLFPAEGQTLPQLRFPEFQDAPEWEIKQLEFVCHMQAGQYVAASNISEQYEEGLYPCYGGNGLRGYTSSFTHSGTYSLIGRQGALCGNVNLGVGQFHATEHALVATPKDNMDVKWLFYDLVNLNLNQYATGQAQPGLSVAVLEKVSTAVPTDIKEQQKIADSLTSFDDLLAAQSQKLDTLKAHKKGLLQQLFPSPEDV